VKEVEKQYRVKAIWKTLQGEGLFAGRPAVFVRLVGCNMWSGYEQTRLRDAERNEANCPLWCDTDFTKEGARSYTAKEMATAITVAGEGIRFCVITGGEPLMQLDAALVKALHKENFFIAIETNGSMSLQESCWDTSTQKLEAPDWIVCSPKVVEEKLRLEFFDELKLVVPDYHPTNFSNFTNRQRSNIVQGQSIPLLWVQPEDGSRLAQAREAAISFSLSHPAWRVSVQTHKILNVD
jgi:7-carboxy-7-deazaguanine synthase